MDVVVTVPRDRWADWIKEGDLPGDEPTGEEWGFFTGGARPDIKPGERVYVVAHGKLRGYAPLTRLVIENGSIGFGRRDDTARHHRLSRLAVRLLVACRGNSVSRMEGAMSTEPPLTLGELRDIEAKCKDRSGALIWAEQQKLILMVKWEANTRRQRDETIQKLSQDLNATQEALRVVVMAADELGKSITTLICVTRIHVPPEEHALWDEVNRRMQELAELSKGHV